MHEPYSAFFPFDFNSCAVGNAHTSHCPICSAVAAFFSSKFEDISVDEEKREEALGICRGGEDRFLGTWCFPYTIFRVLCLKSFIQEMTEFHELEKTEKIRTLFRCFHYIFPSLCLGKCHDFAPSLYTVRKKFGSFTQRQRWAPRCHRGCRTCHRPALPTRAAPDGGVHPMFHVKTQWSPGFLIGKVGD